MSRPRMRSEARTEWVGGPLWSGASAYLGHLDPHIMVPLGKGGAVSAEVDAIAALTCEIQWLRDDIARWRREMQVESSLQFIALSSLIPPTGATEPPAAVADYLAYLAKRVRSLTEELGINELREIVDRFVAEQERGRREEPR